MYIDLVGRDILITIRRRIMSINDEVTSIRPIIPITVTMKHPCIVYLLITPKRAEHQQTDYE